VAAVLQGHPFLVVAAAGHPSVAAGCCCFLLLLAGHRIAADLQYLQVLQVLQALPYRSLAEAPYRAQDAVASKAAAVLVQAVVRAATAVACPEVLAKEEDRLVHLVHLVRPVRPVRLVLQAPPCPAEPIQAAAHSSPQEEEGSFRAAHPYPVAGAMAVAAGLRLAVLQALGVLRSQMVVVLAGHQIAADLQVLLALPVLHIRAAGLLVLRTLAAALLLLAVHILAAAGLLQRAEAAEVPDPCPAVGGETRQAAAAALPCPAEEGGNPQAVAEAFRVPDPCPAAGEEIPVAAEAFRS